jgi:hypothetical protein
MAELLLMLAATCRIEGFAPLALRERQSSFF